VWQGRGFGFDWDNPEWRKPYLQDSGHEGMLTRHSNYYPTTYRPPAVPILMGLVYTLTNRSFAAWRIVECALMAGAVTIAAVVSAGIAGLPAAVLTAILALQSDDLTVYSQQFMTEAMATLMVTLLAWLWLRFSKEGWTLKRAVGLGVALGGLIATRSIFVLWLPVALFVPRLSASKGVKALLVPKAACVLGCLLIAGPWWVRNVAVTRAPMPFGTEGALNMPVGFGPRALRAEGVWHSNREDGADEMWARYQPDLGKFELELAKYRQRLSLKWMRQHPGDVVRLMGLHVLQEIRPHGSPFVDSLLYLAGAAALLFRRSPAVKVVALMLCANLFGIALTWSVEGRFMVPLQPLLVALVGAMAAVVVRQGMRVLDRVEA
jgi:4-amino-4-deoxy-L-arabinose transferase-like glycosyltransferase